MTSLAVNAFLYYTFHFLYLGHLSDVLARLWVAEDISNINTNGTENMENSLLNDMRSSQAWQAFDDSMRESYKATGIIAGLIAAVISGLFSIEPYRSHEVVRTILLTSLTSSVFSASLCLSVLSTVYMNPLNIRHNWESYGIIYIIILSGPSAWLSLALWTLQAAILAIVWQGEGTSAKIAVTTLIGIMFVLRVGTRLYTFPSNRRFADFGLLLIGRKHGMSHHLVNLNEDSRKKRIKYVMKVYDNSTVDVYGAPNNLEKQDDDDETQTQIIDDGEFSSNSRSHGSLGQSQTSRKVNPISVPPSRGGSPAPMFLRPSLSPASGSGQATSGIISVGASFFHPYQGGHGSSYPNRIPLPRRNQSGASKVVSHSADITNEKVNLKQVAEFQGETIAVGPTNSSPNRTPPVSVLGSFAAQNQLTL